MKKEVNRKKHKRFYINGFTLVELLAVIAILAIIGGVIVYFAINIINDTKDKSYKVTINNIENVAMEYAIENQNNISWKNTDINDNKQQYYCVNIQKLIDMGYFKNDVLDSYIDKDLLVKADDYIYIEMDSLTKTITKNKLLSSDENNYNSLCNNVSTVGNINFNVDPYELSKEKNITINYKLLNIDDNVSNYNYYYEYIDVNGNKTDISEDGVFDKIDISREIVVSKNGTIKAYIKYRDEMVANGTLKIDKIDDVAPVINIKVTNGTTYAKKKDVYIELKDSGIGFKIGKYNVKYGWSTNVLSCSDLTDSVVINISNNKAKIGNAKITIDGKNGAGKLYACAVDISDYLGNLMDDTVSSKEVYLDNIGPVIELSNNNSQNVFGNAVIPLRVSDTHSGVDSSSFTSDDILVSIGNDILTSGVSLERVDDNNYNLKISNYDYTGQVKVSIGKDKVLDNASNGNNEVVLNTNIVFENKYTINYILNGGNNGSSAPTSGIYNRVITISNPTKTVTVSGNENGTGATVGSKTSGVQTFAGWTASELNTSTAYYGTSSDAVTTQWSNGATKVRGMYFKNLRNTNGVVNLTANWTPVAFNLPTVTKTGYTCKWNTKTDDSGKSYNSGASYTPSANSLSLVTLYAVCTANTYTVSYTLNGGINGSGAPTSGTYDRDVIISNPSKTVTFIGNANGTGVSFTNQTGSTQTFAGWTSITVGSNAKTGASSSPSAAWSGSSTKNTYFKNLRESGTVAMVANWTSVGVKLPTFTNPIGKTCYWYSATSGGTKYGASGASYIPSATSGSSITAYLQCSNNSYTIGYTLNGGTNYSGAPTSYTYGTGATINGKPTRSGYTFNGWYNGSTTVFSQTISTRATGNKTMVAKWCQNCASVSNGSCSLNASTAGTCIYTTSCNTGYTISNNGKYNPTCTANTYTISYNANGGSGAPSSQTKTYGVTLTLSSTMPTRSGYDFLGWSTSSNATSATYSAGGSYTSNSGTTLYAVWKLSRCIPNFTFNGSYQIVDDNNNTITDINNWRGNWKIRFLSSGTLTFTALNCASSGIDIFVVGGGGNGASGSRYFAQNTYGGGSGGGGGAITVIKFPASVNVSYGIGVGGAGSNSYFAQGGTQYYTAVGGGTPAQPYYCGDGCGWVRPTGGGGGRLGGQTSYYGASNVIVNGGASGNSVSGNYEFNGGSGLRYGASGGYGGSGVSTGYGGSGGNGWPGGTNGGGSGGKGCSFGCSGGNCSITRYPTSGSSASANSGSGGGGGGSACGSGNESYGGVGSGGSGGSGIVIIRNTR